MNTVENAETPATEKSDIKSRYPKQVSCQEAVVELSLMASVDLTAATEFTRQFSDHDLLSFNRDIREPKVLAAWARAIESGNIVSVAASRHDEIIGTTAVLLDQHSWSPHVGELRILVRPDARDIGLGRVLIQESFLIGLDLGLEKLTVNMTLNQDRAITVFEEMGFKSEALLKDHVKDSQGEKHDLLTLAHDVAAVQSKMQAYGIDQAF